jgi:APA family basic amino acid/polyamine antiporter
LTDLARRLGLVSATAAVVGQVIAVGIFLTPAAMAKSLGSPFWVLVVWLVMGAMAVSGALCYGGLAARYPEAGGGYVYLREAWGPRVAFLYGWKCLLVMDPGITAALATGLAAYAAVIVPLGPAAQKALAIAAILGLAAANGAGLRLGDALLRGLTIVKLAALGFLVLWGVARGAGRWDHFLPFVEPRPGSTPFPQALAGAAMAAFFSFGGWWEAAKIGGEVRDPARTVPRALVIGVVAVTLVYILVSMAFIYLVPIEGVASGETFAAQAGTVLFGSAGGKVLAAIVALCVLGSLAAVILIFPRVYYAMARDGLFFAAVGRLHPRFGTPARAIGVQALVASVLVALGTFEQIVAYFVFVTVCFIGLTVVGLFVLEGRRLGEASDVHVPGYPATPLAFLALTAGMLALLGANRPKEALIGVVVVAVGALVGEVMGLGATRPSPGGERA